MTLEEKFIKEIASTYIETQCKQIESLVCCSSSHNHRKKDGMNLYEFKDLCKNLYLNGKKEIVLDVSLTHTLIDHKGLEVFDDVEKTSNLYLSHWLQTDIFKITKVTATEKTLLESNLFREFQVVIEFNFYPNTQPFSPKDFYLNVYNSIVGDKNET